MKTLLTIASSIWVSMAMADTGGPYQFVPDLSDKEVSPILPIPKEAHLLTYFVTHLPTPKWEGNEAEPSSLEWKPLGDYTASVSEIGYVGGYRIFSIRYISKERLERGTTQADRILVVARLGRETKCTPVYFTTGGASTYNHKAKLRTTGKSILLEVSRYHSGSGAHVETIYIGKNASGLVRVSPKK